MIQSSPTLSVMRTRPPPPCPGELIESRFRIGSELGRGGMSVVHRAHDLWTGRDVALKVLTGPADDPAGSVFLQREFRAMTRLRHPRLVEVHDYGMVRPGMPFFTMELLPGSDLAAIRGLPLEQVFQVLIAVGEALAFMHARGYLHRDVKPANVRLVSRREGRPVEVKLMDCGLVTRMEDRTGGLAGTPTHLAPEVWLGAPADVRTDLYSLGVLAFEITAGRLPFEATSGVALLAHKSRKIPDLRALRPEVPPAFERLVRELLAAEPASRPVNAFEVLARLSQFAAVDFESSPAIYLRAPPLVGRGRELGELREVLAEAASGKPARAVILAPPGAGKSRLLEEIALEAELRGSVIARTSGRGFGGAPYQALGELLGPLLRGTGAAEPLARIGGLTPVSPFEPGAATATAATAADPVGTRHAWYAALGSLLEGRAVDHPITLVVDELHLVDAASLEALTAILRSATGKIALLAALPNDVEPAPPVRQLMAESRSVVLDRLREVEIGELLERALGPTEPTATLLGEIERYSGGNVSFVLEILRGLAQRGLIRPAYTKVRLPEALDAADLPRSLGEALERRMAALSAPALEVARVAAVAGRVIEIELVRTLTDLSDDAFVTALDEGSREEVVQVCGHGLCLRDPRLREVLYEGIGAEARRALHHRLALALEQRASAEPRALAADLGHHFALGGWERRALDCLVLAGDLRYDEFAYVDAGEAYRRALALLAAAPPHQRLAVERKLNDRLGRIGFYEDHHDALPYLKRARELHLRHGALWMIVPLARFVGAKLAVAGCLMVTVLGNLFRGHRHPLRRALEHLLDSFAATAYLCNCYTYTGRQARALEEAEALRPLIYSRRRLPRAGYLIARAPALVFTQRLLAGAAAAEEALAVLDRDRTTPVAEADRVNATGGALVTRLWADLERGFGQSPWWQRVEAYVQQHPTTLLETWWLELRLFGAYRSGYLATARTLWQALAEKAKLSRVFFVQGKGRAWFGMACLDAGQTGEALDTADEIVGLAREQDNPMLEAMGLLLRGMALHAWEHFGDAVVAFEQAAALALREDVDAHGVYRDVLLAHAALALDLGDPARAGALVELVEQATPPVEPPHELHLLRALRIRGQIALAEAAPERAVAPLRRALGLAEQIEDLLETGLSAHFLAQALARLGRDAEAAKHGARAKRLLQDRGARHDLRRLAYSELPSPLPSATRPGPRPAAALVDLEPPSSVTRNPASHLGDTQSELHSRGHAASEPRPAPAESAVRSLAPVRADGEP